MPFLLQRFGNPLVKPRLDLQHIRHELMMHPRGSNRIMHGHAKGQQTPGDLHSRADDPGAASCSRGKEDGSVIRVLSNDGADGREGAFPRCDEVGLRRREAEGVIAVGLGEVVHLVVSVQG